MLRSISFILGLCLMLLSSNSACIASEAPARLVDAKLIVRIGGLVSSIGNSTEKLQSVLEQENAYEARQTIDELREDVHNLGKDLKKITGPKYYDYINNVSRRIDDNLVSIQLEINDGNFEQAKEEYALFLQNWERLDDYYAERIGEIVRDKEELRGWLNWLLDILWDWFLAEEAADPSEA